MANLYLEIYSVKHSEGLATLQFKMLTMKDGCVHIFLESMVRGYHEYKSLWTNPFNGEELLHKREISNACNPQAVTVKKEIDHVLQVVDHVPRYILSICSIFITIRRGGITMQVYNNWKSALFV